MMIPKYIVLCLSGGLDSVTGLYDAKDQGCEIHCVSFDYGQRHVQEIECARYHCRRLDIPLTRITIPQLKGSTLTDGTGGFVVPLRNTVFLGHATHLAAAEGAEAVTYYCNKDDAELFPDCRPEFVKSFNAMLKAQEISVEVCAPYIQKAKWWIAGRARDLGVEINQTWSCYKGGKEPCGECEACKKRQNALWDLSIK